MNVEISLEERLMYLVMMAGAGNRLLYEIYRDSDEATRSRILLVMAENARQLEPIMEAYGFERNPEGVARAMALTEDLIGCEPRGELLSVVPEEAVRKVTSCPWAASYSDDGGTCRLVMAAMQEGIGRRHGLEIFCEQNMAEGADYCIWKVRKSGTD
jgi:hypothetical protein